MSESSADRWLLEVTGASRPPASMPLSGVLVVGSDPKRAGYVVTGDGVESAHCAIGRTKGGGFAVKDLGTNAGTIVNGKRVESARLAAGDVLALGSVTMRVVDPDAPARAPTPQKNQQRVGLDIVELTRSLPPLPTKLELASETTLRPSPLPSIPGYKIDRRVGRGGMGDVYLAEQISLSRQVALKILSQRFEENRDFVQRFQAEARAAAALNHPNVVTVYDVGEAMGKHYLSMEFMDRGNLEDRLKNGAKIEEREVLGILRDATSGLVYAEARGIVHRDLKPANLMQNHVGTTKIADLGLATHVESEEAQPADKKIFGTPHFMSPEQVRGERVDSRSDLYSLGATAYRLLTGRTPYEGRDAREIVKAVLRDEPKSMREFVPELSAGTCALVERLMKKESAQRYASASETLAEIERLRNPSQHAVTIAPGTTAKKSSKGALFVLFLALAGGGGAFWWNTRNQVHPFDPVVQNPSIASDPSAGEPDPASPDDGDATAKSEPISGGATTKSDGKDDKELQLFEAQGKVALLELLGSEMPDTVKREALRALAAQFQGTAAASEALEKADAITNRLLAEANATTARKTGVDAMIAKLRDVAKLDDVPPHPGRSYLAMRAVDGQAPLRDYPEFVDQRKMLETVVARTATAYVDQILTEAGRKLDRGDYDGGLAQMTALMPVFDLPEFPAGEGPSGVSELYEKGRIARERLHTLEQTRDVFEKRREREDALTIALGFGGASGLERDLRSFDFVAAKQRVDALITKLGVGPARASLNELSLDCDRARNAIETLTRECSSNGWRRKSFTDPREKKSVTRNATGADAIGLLYEGEGGAADLVPWSAFGGNTKELSKLFFERLTRDWTGAELHAIAALLKIQACIEVVDMSAKMLDAQKKANFTESNQREVLEIGNTLSTWSSRAPDEKDEIAREMSAASILAVGLRQMTETQWSTAVSQIERLLYECPGTLIVRLLSNGKPPEEPK
ncbi:MAG: FHA domain-containing serine/threonine-protein kinase [Planctomycetota bacterium]|nr:FHA domain-containing serine/threonine-protein kinase [Planctomycetota bacterium]